MGILNQISFAMAGALAGLLLGNADKLKQARRPVSRLDEAFKYVDAKAKDTILKAGSIVHRFVQRRRVEAEKLAVIIRQVRQKLGHDAQADNAQADRSGDKAQQRLEAVEALAIERKKEMDMAERMEFVIAVLVDNCLMLAALKHKSVNNHLPVSRDWPFVGDKMNVSANNCMKEIDQTLYKNFKISPDEFFALRAHLQFITANNLKNLRRICSSCRINIKRFERAHLSRGQHPARQMVEVSPSLMHADAEPVPFPSGKRSASLRVVEAEEAVE
jgi:hypothetical protein